MKKPNENLFRLIQAMSPAEKRYFKRHYASEQNITTVLFDFINSMSAYDEEALKKQLDSKVAKILKVYKVQLYDLILKSLVSYHQKKSVLSKIRAGLEEIDVLIEKQLHEQAGYRLLKLKQLALKYEEFTYLIELAQLEFQLFHMQHDRIGISKHPVFTEMKEYLGHLDHRHAFSVLGHQLMDTARNQQAKQLTEAEAKRLESVLESDLLQIPPAKLPFRAQLSRNTLLSFLYGLLQNEEGDLAVRKNNVDLFDLHPHFKQTMPFNYIGVLRNYLNYCVHHLITEEVQRVLDDVKAFVKKHKEMESHLIHFYYGELHLHFRLGHFAKVRQSLEPKINKHIKKYKLRSERILGLIYQPLIVVNLLQEDYVTAQQYFRDLEEVKPRLRETIVAFIHILELVSHCESGDYFLIDRSISSWQRRRASDPDYIDATPFYQDCLEFFKKVARNPYEKTEHAKTLFDRLSDYAGSGDQVFEDFRGHFLDRWLRAIVTRKSFAEKVEEENETLEKKDARQKLPGTSRLV